MAPKKTEQKIPPRPPFIKRGWGDCEQKERKSILISILVIFFISALIMLRQLISKDYFSCHGEDTFAYVSWAWQFVEALKEGIIYPRWLPINFWDYGGPTFILIPPCAFYIVAFFNMFTGSIITAMNITKFMALFLSGAGMFFLVREFYSEKVALLTASFSVVFPYQIFQFYYVGTFASVVSCIWFAPIILFTYRYIKNGSYKNVLYAGLCYGGLILTHLINAYMFTFVLAAFIIYMSIIQKRLKDVLLGLLIIGSGILISAAYTLPVIFEKKFLKLGAFVGEGSGFIFDYHNFFIIPNMTGKFSSSHLWQVYYDTFIFFVIFSCIFIILSLIQIFKLSRNKTAKDFNAINKFFLGTALCSIFLLFGLSGFLWETIPFFKYIQFPYRWLNITAFAVVLSSAVVFFVLMTTGKKERRYNFFIIVLFLICLLVDYKYMSSTCLVTEQQLIPVKAAHWYIFTMPAQVDREKIDKGEESEKKVIVQKGMGKAEIEYWESAERGIAIKASSPIILRIRTFNFPGWKAYVDGVQTEIKTEDDVGAMLIEIPKGKHELVLRFEDTPVRYYAKLLSMVSLVSIVVLIIFSKKIKKKIK